MADAVADRIVVEAPPEVVWDVIADFEAYPDWNEEITSAEVLETGDDGWATRVRFTVDASVLGTATVVLAYRYTDTAMSWHLEDGDKVRRNDGTYTLRDQDDGRTEVTYELELEPSVPVPGLLRRQAARRIVSRALQGMKQRAEAA